MLRESAKNLCMLKNYRLKSSVSEWINLRTVLSKIGLVVVLILNMPLKCYQVLLLVDPSLLYLCSKTRCWILLQIAAAASYKKVVMSDGKIAIK